MNRYYAIYTDWEDYKNGMYEPPKSKAESDIHIANAVTLLSNELEFKRVCELVLSEWKISCMVNFTNKSCNKLAWLGQASCCYKYGTPEICTRQAWKLLTPQKRNVANLVAYECVLKFNKEYEAANKAIHKNVGGELLF